MTYPNPITQLSNELLIEAYQKSYSAKCSIEFISLLKTEIDKRGLSSSQLMQKPTCFYNDYYTEIKKGEHGNYQVS
ncbi:sporulation histidine kinase inhibitor Sda [Paraliobacillus sediminis]|uniref:sporulation histidine kinase inhibitor Sda n=1 Tax=Paraliobacillus sediminis TaxID=1885916 RepID=UPI001F077070|nr:sporulation histidine kinase inhibitor Sda [Paraliobacillus sediminis]